MFGRYPTVRSAGLPSLKMITVGIDMMPSCIGTVGFSSISIFTTVTLSPSSLRLWLSVGLALGAGFRAIARRRLPGCLVVGRVKATALEDHASRVKHLAELALALGADLERLVGHPLLDLELVSAVAATVAVNGQFLGVPNYKRRSLSSLSNTIPEGGFGWK